MSYKIIVTSTFKERGNDKDFAMNTTTVSFPTYAEAQKAYAAIDGVSKSAVHYVAVRMYTSV